MWRAAGASEATRPPFKAWMKWTLLALSAALALALPKLAEAALPVGKAPPSLKIEGDEGGRVTGGAWRSGELKGKVSVLFYVDPDEADLNDPLAEALRKADFPHDKFVSFAIINMDATWLPNGLIQGKLEKKQKEFPTAVYVMDKDKILVKKWGLGDDNSDVVVFDREGKVLFSKDGKLSSAEVNKVVSTVQEQIAAAAAPPPAAPAPAPAQPPSAQ
jgi:uncharacterized protein